ncbi:SDR family oxidoreductase [Dyella sp. EPa41]|uniref:SDR family oxidoreductase n=1 Tax=Dyella sp. EPa41 TaxID=1561194 RepID=UPI001914E113|nr:SDR family oxidoreductase [Dyella sp. EPa41]
MKIVVIGGTGLIGGKVVERLRKRGHEVLAASPSSGVNTLTGEGLDEAMAGASVVIDLANSPSFEDQAVLEFFQQSGRHLFAAEKKAGVKHHVALSVVGAERLASSGYMRAKVAQEQIIRASGIPFTIIHSTQFFEFLGSIVKAASKGDAVHVSPALMQPIASEDVADAVADYALDTPANGIVEIAGPDKISMSGLVERFLELTHDPHHVFADVDAPYFGAILQEDSLLPVGKARLGPIDFKSWFDRSEYARAA